MTFSLHQLARSRRLRAVGALAWLMLVINSLAAAPMGMTGSPHSHAMHATVAAVSEHCHHHTASEGSTSCCDGHAGCCGGSAGHACNCAAMCGSTLPPGPANMLAPATITANYATPLPSSAPSVNTAPPLRPPAA